ncbi:MAG: hypothetical protein H7841_00615 [Magnetospirillum sp. WYHS-4]
MLFNSVEFVILFLPLTLLAFHLVPIRWRMAVLCLASLVFYGWADWIPLAFMVLSVVWAYGFAFLSQRWRSPWVLGAAVFFPLWVLFMFRYLDFTLTEVGAGPETRQTFYFFLNVVLPAGISFFSFQIASYSYDVHDGKDRPERSLLKLTTYISAYPQLIAGPILRFDDLSSQLDRLGQVKDLGINWPKAIKFLSIGLFMKVAVSDLAAVMSERFDLATNPSSLDAFISVLLYSFRIYYDFWAYSVIAIGLGEMLGLRIPINFNEPYIARSPRDFWRRWHLSLSTWLRDYVYLRLGGNRNYVRNIAIVFAACGIWHGAGWNFLAWGLYHAFFVILYHYLRPWWDPLPKALQIAATFLIVTLGWPLFYLDFGAWLQLLERIFLGFDYSMTAFGLRHLAFIAAVGGWTFLVREARWLYNAKPWPVVDWPVVHAVMLFGATLFFAWSRTFIYFRF